MVGVTAGGWVLRDSALNSLQLRWAGPHAVLFLAPTADAVQVDVVKALQGHLPDQAHLVYVAPSHWSVPELGLVPAGGYPYSAAHELRHPSVHGNSGPLDASRLRALVAEPQLLAAAGAVDASKPSPQALLGLLPAAVGLWLLIGGSSLFARPRTNINTFRSPDVLVTTGVFRFTRNPMYLGFLLLLSGLVVCLGTLTPWLAVVVFFAAAQFWYVPFEERACEAAFGDAYLSYKARTRRWL